MKTHQLALVRTSKAGASQTFEICPLSEFLIPSIYWIFLASQNTYRWRIIDQMFAKALPEVARVKKFHYRPLKSLCLAGASELAEC